MIGSIIDKVVDSKRREKESMGILNLTQHEASTNNESDL